MEANRRLALVDHDGGGHRPRRAEEAGFTLLLEIWHSAIAELLRGIPPEHLRILLIAGRAGPVSLDELARALGTSVTAATVTCRSLEQAGLLRRRHGAPGSGTIVISLAASGRRLVDQLQEQRRAVLDHVLGSLTLESRDALARALSEFAADLDTAGLAAAITPGPGTGPA